MSIFTGPSTSIHEREDVVPERETPFPDFSPLRLLPTLLSRCFCFLLLSDELTTASRIHVLRPPPSLTTTPTRCRLRLLFSSPSDSSATQLTQRLYGTTLTLRCRDLRPQGHHKMTVATLHTSLLLNSIYVRR
jgi:hypothetical protein